MASDDDADGDSAAPAEIWDGQSDPYGLVAPCGGADDDAEEAGGSKVDAALPAGIPATLLLAAGLGAARGGTKSAPLEVDPAWDAITDPHALVQSEGSESGSGDESDGGSDGKRPDVVGEIWDGQSDPYSTDEQGVGSLKPCGTHTRFELPDTSSEEESEDGESESESEGEYEFVCDDADPKGGAAYLCGAATLQTADGFAVPALQHLLAL